MILSDFGKSLMEEFFKCKKRHCFLMTESVSSAFHCLRMLCLHEPQGIVAHVDD